MDGAGFVSGIVGVVTTAAATDALAAAIGVFVDASLDGTDGLCWNLLDLDEPVVVLKLAFDVDLDFPLERAAQCEKHWFVVDVVGKECGVV